MDWWTYQTSFCDNIVYHKDVCLYEYEQHEIERHDYELHGPHRNLQKDFAIEEKENDYIIDYDSIDEQEIKPVDDEIFVPDWDCRWYRCCKWEWYLAPGEDVWLIQNSWGSSWGESGLIRLRKESGAGVSGMNQYIFWVTVQ